MILVLTEHQPSSIEALTHAGGFLERGSHSPERADVQARPQSSGLFASASGFSRRSRRGKHQGAGDSRYWGVSPETAARVAKLAPFGRTARGCQAPFKDLTEGAPSPGMGWVRPPLKDRPLELLELHRSHPTRPIWYIQ